MAKLRVRRKVLVDGGGRVWTDVPQALVLLLDDLVGTFYGETRADVVAFILKNWVQEHYDVALRVHDDQERTIR